MKEPAYDRRAVVPSVVHLGPGVFHRAHQAAYADAVLGTGSRTGGIRAVSLRSPRVRDALAPQDFRYCLVERGPAGEQARVIGAIAEVLVAAADPEPALAALVDPDVTVVTITVTEHGYGTLGPGGGLDTARPEIRHDLTHPHAPRSLPGMLVEALARRRAAGTAPFTVASCDNLPSNGKATRRVVTELATHRGGDLADWIAATVGFPSSMVDRMVPGTTDADRDRVRTSTGMCDAWPVVTEPFSQWVLEDTFPTGRPPWERAGVELVSDVAPYERAKLRILNAAHSTLAYLGLLAGHTHIAQATADPALATFVTDLLTHEVLPTLVAPPGWDLPAYAAQVLDRFGNSELPYTTAKVAGDGSQKIPVRVLSTVADRLATGAGTDRLARVVAAWIACALGPRSRTAPLTDPGLTDLLGAAATPMRSPAAAVAKMLGLPSVFGPALAGHPGFSAQLHRHTRALWNPAGGTGV